MKNIIVAHYAQPIKTQLNIIKLNNGGRELDVITLMPHVVHGLEIALNIARLIINGRICFKSDWQLTRKCMV